MNIPEPDVAEGALACYGADAVGAYAAFYNRRDDRALDALLGAVLGALADRPGDAAPPSPGDDLREDLGLDSIGLAEAAFLIEDLFGCRMENAEVAGIRTVGDLREWLRARFPGRAEHGRAG